MGILFWNKNKFEILWLKFIKLAQNNFVKKNQKLVFKLRKQNILESEIMNIKRGDIYYADLSPVVGSEQGGIRPVLIVQNDVGNKFSPTVIAAAITSQHSKASLPTHIQINAKESGLSKDSVVLLEQIRR